MTVHRPEAEGRAPVTLFLCGDVMLGRGIDQLLPHPSDPALKEPYVRDAREYVALVEEIQGPIGRPVAPSYFWGDALPELERAAPHARLINLETSITTSAYYWPGKGIHYRLHPENIACVTSAHIDACALANNHVLDFGREGLVDTLRALREAGVQTSGAGRHAGEARLPARVGLPGTRSLLFFSMGTETSGIYEDWAAGEDRSGVDLLPDLSEATARGVVERICSFKRPGDLTVASIHWGSNWGYDIPEEHIAFARHLIEGGVDLVHGHSSHHPRPMEVYRGKLILYGCGDFINDYEGISGYEEFRSDLRPMYFAKLGAATGALEELRIVPLQTRRLSLRGASLDDSRWLGATLSDASRPFGARVVPCPDGSLVLQSFQRLSSPARTPRAT